jgi:glycosyltransferase involved in cell wall biosynthesis
MTDWLLLQSKEDYELSVENKFLSPSKIIHLSNGVDLKNIFDPAQIGKDEKNGLREELKIQNDDIVFSFIGRLVEEKGVIELLNAFGELKQRYSNIKLLLIGDLPESERDVTAINEIKRLMDQEGVCSLGFRNDINQLLTLSDVFVLPSYREGLPRSIIEAMAMENAIIATNIRGCREQVFKDNGILVERRSSKQLVNAMETMVKDPEAVKRMGSASREIALELFNEEKVLEKQMELFGELMG